MNISDRLSKLEAVTDAPKIPPLVLGVHMTADECKLWNERAEATKGKNNPLTFELRPVAERVKHESND